MVSNLVNVCLLHGHHPLESVKPEDITLYHTVLLDRYVTGHLHTGPVQLRAYAEPRRHPCRQPPLLQLTGLQRDPNEPRLHHRRDQEPRNYRRDITLPVQPYHALGQLSAFL